MSNSSDTRFDNNSFQAAPAPTSEELQTLLTRVMKVLTRLGALIEEHETSYLADTDLDPALAPIHSAACTYRIALGPRAGQKVLTWKDPAVRLASQEALQPQGCVSGPSDPTRKMDARLSDSEVRGLIYSRVLWYFRGQAKRPFIIHSFPIFLVKLMTHTHTEVRTND